MIFPKCGHSGSPTSRTLGNRIGHKYFICPKCGKAQRSRRLRPGITTKPKAKAAAYLYDRWAVSAGSLSLSILVWGPSPKDTGPAGKKRHDIRAEIESRGHKVVFSEDITFGGVPANIQEILQTGTIDCVVNLAASHGSIGEAHEFALGLKERCLLWLSEKAQDKFIGSGLGEQLKTLGCPPLYFSESDLTSCVIALGSADWVEAMRGVYWSTREMRNRLDIILPPRMRTT